MADSAALLVDKVLPHQPMRQWDLSVPFFLRFLFASNPKTMTGVLGIVYRAISTHLTHKAVFTKSCAQPGLRFSLESPARRPQLIHSVKALIPQGG